MKSKMSRSLLALGLSLFCTVAHAEIRVTDDQGNAVVLARPAERIISLAPHVTELLFAAGAGAKIIATTKHSDYPQAAKNIPVIGDLRQLDLERIIALKPDLLVVWMHGAYVAQLDKLRAAGIPFFFSEPHKLAHIPQALQKMGQLAGTDVEAQQAVSRFNQEWQRLHKQYQAAPRVRVFYQVWSKPLYTLNDEHIMSDAIRLCGGENIFGKLPVISPVVSVEAVLQENPDVIILGDSMQQGGRGVELWKNYPGLRANKNGNLALIDGDSLNRAGPRIIDGAKAICVALDRARNLKNNKGEK